MIIPKCFPAVEMRLSILESMQLKKISFLNYNISDLIVTLSDKAPKGTVVNRTFLHEGLLDITLIFFIFPMKH